jgi:hypothetical protein
MKTRARLDEHGFEQLLAAAYLLQQQREALPFPTAKPPLAISEAERLAAIADVQAVVHADRLCLQDRLQLVAERAQRITGGAGAAIWLLRGSQAVCQLACGVLVSSTGQSVAFEGSRLTACLRDGAVLRCANAKSDPRIRYDALPGATEGSAVAVPIHYEGRVQGALEVTFAQPWGFEDADVRTCQILSGLISETVTVAAGQERKNALESERATLLDALDRLQPHLSKLLNGVEPPSQSQSWIQERSEDRMEEADETPLPATGLPPAPAGPTHGLARLGKYLLDQQEQRGASSSDLEHETLARPASREVHTALNLSVTTQQSGGDNHRASSARPADELDFETRGDSQALERVAPSYSQPHADPYDGYASQTGRPEPSLLTPADEPWHGEPETPSTDPPKVAAGFWRLHMADVCLAVSAVLLAASLIWALWPQPKRTVVASSNAPTAPAERRLSPLEELLVSMGLAEAPPPPATYAGAPGTRVWVDVQSALYYCPGAEPYGKTPKGKFLTQRDAQDEQFQPARGQPCE